VKFLSAIICKLQVNTQNCYHKMPLVTENNTCNSGRPKQLLWHLQWQKLRLPCAVLSQSEVSKFNVVVVYGGKTSLNEPPQRPEQMSRLQPQQR